MQLPVSYIVRRGCAFHSDRTIQGLYCVRFYLTNLVRGLILAPGLWHRAKNSMDMVDWEYHSFLLVLRSPGASPGDQGPGIGSNIYVDLDVATGKSFLSHCWQRAPGRWTNRDAEDREVKVSPIPWCSATWCQCYTHTNGYAFRLNNGYAFGLNKWIPACRLTG